MAISISTDKSKLDIEFIHRYLSEQSYWAKGRDQETVKHTLDVSLCFGLYSEGKQVGFARVVSDNVVLAWILDLFIDPAYQGQGLGKQLMTVITEHPDLRNVKRWGLNTADAHGLYRQFGFGDVREPHLYMEKINDENFSGEWNSSK